MDFTNIQKAVVDAWDFIWPPTFHLVLIYLLALWLAPLRLKKLGEYLLNVRWANWALNPKTYKFLKRFDLIKLAPIVVFVLLLLFLFIVNTSVSAIGYIVPGNIIYSNGRMLEYGLKGEMYQLAKRFPNSRGSYELGDATDQFLSTLDWTKSPSLKHLDEWDKNFGNECVNFYIAKFYFFLVLILGLYGIGHSRRFHLISYLFCLLFTLSLCLYFFSNQLVALEQKTFAYAEAVRVLVLTSKNPDNIPAASSKNPDEFDSDKIAESFSDVWSFHLFDSYGLMQRYKLLTEPRTIGVHPQN